MELQLLCYSRLGNPTGNGNVGGFLVLLKSCWLLCVLTRGAVFHKNFFNQK